MKKIAILGSTGSIGQQSLQVIDEFPDTYKLGLISGHSNYQKVLEQVIKYKPEYVFISHKETYDKLLKEDLGMSKIFYSFSDLKAVLQSYRPDICIGGISGAAGIGPTLTFLEEGITVALANKETLVTAGCLVREVIEKSRAKLITVDSEHSAIMQCMEDTKASKRILLTASGGPFRLFNEEELKNVTPEDALKHPTWNMGKKITIDSATLMNKGLEVIEANWLFNIPYKDIEVVIHPESIVHSMVEYGDGSILAHLGPKDMRIPIQYALSWPERKDNTFPKIDLTQIAQLNFYKPDFEKFPALRLAYEAGNEAGSMPAVLNAANEVAVDLFLQRRISFIDIPSLTEKVMSQHMTQRKFDLEEILVIDSWARKKAVEYSEKIQR